MKVILQDLNHCFLFTSLIKNNSRTIHNYVKRFISILIFFIMFGISTSFASHMRYLNLTWRTVSGRTVEFKFSYAQAGGYTTVGTKFNWSINTGDGGWLSIPMTVTSNNQAEDYFYSEGTATYTYGANGNYLANFASCCRIYGMVNNSSGSVDIRTLVNVGTGNSSPIATLPPVVNVSQGLSAATFSLPANDPDGDVLTYRLANSTEMGGGVNPAGLSVNNTTGLVTFNTTNASAGQLYSAAIVVSDGKTEITVDFIIKITQQSIAPEFDYLATPANGTVYQVSPGQPVNFNIRATDSDVGDIVTLSAVGVPIGANLSPALPTSGNPAQASFSWTPSNSNLGTNVINFIAQDKQGVQKTTSVTIQVSLKPVFDVPPTPIANSTTFLTPGSTLSLNIKASDPDINDKVQIVSALGLPAGANLSGGLPTVLANPTSTTLTWTPVASQWGLSTVTFTAKDTYGDQTNHKLNFVVNSAPKFVSNQPSVSIVAGQLFTYNIKATDSDLAYGDELEVVSANVLPGWLTLTDNGNGTATLSGTPQISDAGTVSIKLMAEDKYLHDGGLDTQLFNITVVPCNTTLTAAVSNVTCFGANNGSINLTVNGGTAPFSYAWSTGATVEDPSGLGAGTYTVTVTDKNNCSEAITVTITEPAAIAISALGATSVCQGESVKLSLPINSNVINFDDISTSEIGGIPSPYRGFYWNTNYNEYPMYYLKGGNYSGTGYANGVISPGYISFNPYGYTQSEIRSANGPFNYQGAYFTSAWASQAISFKGFLNGALVYSSQAFTISTTTPKFIQLNWSNIDRIEIISTGSQWVMDNFTIGTGESNPAGQWHVNGSPIAGATSEQFTATQSGTYQYITTSGCSSNSIAVQVTPQPAFTTNTTNVTCAGGSDGSIAVLMSGSDTYSYSKDGGLTFQSSSAFTGLSVGTYTMVVKNAAGCVSEPQTVSIIQKDSVKPTALAQDVLIYLDANGQGSTTVEAVNNGSADNCDIASIALSKTDFSCANVGANTVTLTVTDVNGNVSTTTAVVTVKDNQAPALASVSDIAVNNDAQVCGATVTYTTPLGTDNCSVTTVQTAGLPSGSVFPVGTTVNTFVATDASGNSTITSFSVTVTDNEKPVLASTAAQFFCFATSNTYDIDALSQADNCAIATTTFAITGATNRSGTGTSADGLFNPGVSTITWTVTDIHGNVSTASTSVTVNPAVSVSVADAFALSSGVSANTVYPGYAPASSLTLVAAPAGGTGGYTFLWSTGATTSSIVVTTAGTYTVTIKDTKGCTATVSKIINAVNVAYTDSNNGKANLVSLCHKGQKVNFAASAVSAHLAHGCSLDPCSSTNRVAKVTTNTETVEAVNLITYPNPAVAQTNIEFNMVNAGSYSLEVYDLKGTLVKVLAKGNSESNKLIYNELDVTSYAEGVYLVKLLTEKQVFTKRILVAK